MADKKIIVLIISVVIFSATANVSAANASVNTILSNRSNNSPPTAPIINGDTNIEVGKSKSFNFKSDDIDGDQVYYYIDWGDESPDVWNGPYYQGITVPFSHTWTEKGDYTIRAKARDIHDAESSWSSLAIKVPTSTSDTISLTSTSDTISLTSTIRNY